MEKMRLQKYLAKLGIDSRRKCEELIKDGKVKINGKIAELGMTVCPETDIVEYNGEVVKQKKEEKVYILLNKPIGYVTTVKDQFRKRYCTWFS